MRRVLGLRRRSKYILIDLDSDETLIVHLGMSGRMLVSGIQLGQFFLDHPAVEKHDHVVLHMENNARITFNDARRFGMMDLACTVTVEQHKLLASLGPEPLGNSFDEAYLISAFAGKTAPINHCYWTKESLQDLAIYMSVKCFTAPRFYQCIRRGGFPSPVLAKFYPLFERSLKRPFWQEAQVLKIIVKLVVN